MDFIRQVPEKRPFGDRRPYGDAEHESRQGQSSLGSSVIVAFAFKRALDLLAQSREALERTANLLLEREALGEVDLSAIAAQILPQRQETGAASTA